MSLNTNFTFHFCPFFRVLAFPFFLFHFFLFFDSLEGRFMLFTVVFSLFLFSFLFSYFLGFPHTHTTDDVVVAWGTLHFTSELPTYILFGAVLKCEGGRGGKDTPK